MRIQLKKQKRGVSALIILAVFVFYAPLGSQWAVRYDNSFASPSGKLTVTNDGGCVIPCQSFLIKISSTGSLEWQYKYFGGLYSSDICQNHDGGFVLSGFERSLPGKAGALMIKLFPNGNIEWQKSYKRDKPLQAQSIKQTKDQGYVVSGSVLEGETDIWFLKMNSAGQMEWGKKYRVYQLDKGSRILIAEVNEDTLSCLHRNIKIKQTYKYTIVSVDEFGRESYPHYILFRSLEPKQNPSQKYENGSMEFMYSRK